MTSFLRQSAARVGLVPTTSPYEIAPAVLPSGMLGTANSRLVACMCVAGPGYGANQANVNHAATFPIDMGDADSSNSFSTDILIYNEQGTDTGTKDIYFGLTANDSPSYIAAWVGEYIEIDQSNYGYQGNAKDSNGNVDYDASYSWSATGQNLSLTRSAGNNCNDTPELSIWAVGGPNGTGVLGQNYGGVGYESDGANIWIAVQEAYFNATGKFTATWTLTASGYYLATNFTMKTLIFPDPLPAGYPALPRQGAVYRM